MENIDYRSGGTRAGEHRGLGAACILVSCIVVLLALFVTWWFTLGHPTPRATTFFFASRRLTIGIIAGKAYATFRNSGGELSYFAINLLWICFGMLATLIFAIAWVKQTSRRRNEHRNSASA